MSNFGHLSYVLKFSKLHGPKTMFVHKLFSRIDYEIPERYRNAVFMANAAFFDSANWFLHRAYEAVFPSLKNNFRQKYKELNVSDLKVHEKLENIVESVDQCNSIIDVRFPVRRESGHLEVVRGFRAHYGETVHKSPCLGGLRIHEGITRDHMKALAMLSFMKNSCLGTGLGGAMGGIKINPKEYSAKELQTIIGLYTSELYKKGYCSHLDVLHPDINTSEREMKWISETYTKCSGRSMNAVVTGKPSEDGGVEGFHKSSALGAFKALETFLNNAEVMLKTGSIKLGLKNKRFIIQGLGKVGKPLSLMLMESGAICVGVKEWDAYLYDPKGIDLNDLFEYREKNGTITNFGLSKTEFPESIFTEECDILIFAAHQKSLACYVARDVKAKVILEAADGPVTPASHKILVTKSKLIIPDIYAGAGSNVISYFEYLRNLQQIGLSIQDLLRCSSPIYANILKNIGQDQQRMAGGPGGCVTQFDDVFVPLDCNFSKNAIDCIYSGVGEEITKNLDTLKLGIDVKTAAYVVAIRNIFKAIFEQKRFVQ